MVPAYVNPPPPGAPGAAQGRAPPAHGKQDTLPSTPAAVMDPDVDTAGETFALTPEQAARMIEEAKQKIRR
jgi:hypothetical protein